MYLHLITFELVAIVDESPLPWSYSQSLVRVIDKKQINDSIAKDDTRVLTQVTWELKKGSNRLYYVILGIYTNF